ncbi:hypothetical protein DM02DRAFT_71865 [Periconia macrospinosa]|uniref:Rhodopsin domain-containing protein n=1 Tax=Periconia macrospinosa TaxID=97972 RepID=A0A2V1E934_9PLEO|nr:hypothetical protein DM02DRAFT_71865 [Periconia macrospinosa]
MGEKRQAGALAVTCLFPILAGLFVSGRIASRCVGRNFGWDDWLILLALLLLLCETVGIYQFILASHTGFRAKDIPKQTVDHQVFTAKWSFVVQIFYHPVIGAARASIVMFLFRVKDPRPRIRFALLFACTCTLSCVPEKNKKNQNMVARKHEKSRQHELTLHKVWMNLAYTISTTLVTIFQCSPISYSYLKPKMDVLITNADGTMSTRAGGKCIHSLAFILGSCTGSILLDLIIIPIPTIMVYNLQMARRNKIAIALVMSMGWIATLASISRLVVYYIRYTTPDRSYNIGVVSSVVEPSLAIIAACAPTLRRLFATLLPSYFEVSASPPPSLLPGQVMGSDVERCNGNCGCGCEGVRRGAGGDPGQMRSGGLEVEMCSKCRNNSRKSRNRSQSTVLLGREYYYHHQLDGSQLQLQPTESQVESSRPETAIKSMGDI